MDLVDALSLAIKALAALVIFYIAFVIVTGWRSAKPADTPLARRASCGGIRNNAECGKPVYRCSNCSESGCQLKGCSNRRFEPPGKCRSCGYPNTMQRP